MNFSKFDTKRLREKHGALFCKDQVKTTKCSIVTNSLIPTTIEDPSWNPFSDCCRGGKSGIPVEQTFNKWRRTRSRHLHRVGPPGGPFSIYAIFASPPPPPPPPSPPPSPVSSDHAANSPTNAAINEVNELLTWREVARVRRARGSRRLAR